MSIFLGCERIIVINSESHQSLIEDVDAPRVHTRDHHVQAQVEFKTIDQEGIVHIF